MGTFRSHRLWAHARYFLPVLVAMGCSRGAAGHPDVLKTWDSAPGLAFNACRVGVGHYVGITPFGVTGGRPITLRRVEALGPADAVTASGQIAYFGNGAPIGGADGDEELRKRMPDLRTAPMDGAVVQPGQEPFYLLVRIATRRPGPIKLTGIRLYYSVRGTNQRSHDFPYELVLNDYDDPKAPECRIPRG